MVANHADKGKDLAGQKKYILNEKALHTVTLDPEKCVGCVTCMKRCPTEAIRVRDGKASVNYDLCIGCGECVRLCYHHAKNPSHDSIDTMADFKYKIVLPPPSFYAQFNNLKNVDIVLNALLELGFDEVYEVGQAAEYCSNVTKMMLDNNQLKKPVLSTACPAVLELILMRYQNLKENLINLLPPVDLAGKIAREKAVERGVNPDDIGVYFISPCPAKVFALKTGIGVEKPYVDRVLSSSEVYMKILPLMKSLETEKSVTKLSALGLRWGVTRGEANSLYRDNTIAADGMENVISVLELLEDGKLDDIDFIELNACISGCVGGVMNIESPFVARARMHKLAKKLPATLNSVADLSKSLQYFLWETVPESNDVFKLSDDRLTAFQKIVETEQILATLPLADCGLCGAPSCKSFAEDIANGVIPKNSVCLRKEEK